jgi:hypothetical protein
MRAGLVATKNTRRHASLPRQYGDDPVDRVSQMEHAEPERGGQQECVDAARYRSMRRSIKPAWKPYRPKSRRIEDPCSRVPALRLQTARQ